MVGSENGGQDEDEALPHLGEPLEDILDLQTWRVGDELGQTYARIEAEVRESLAQEERVSAEVRRRVLPLIASRQSAPPGAGLYQVNAGQLEWMHRHLLFNGATVAADGTVAAHDTLLLTIAQIGVCTVSYSGETGEFRKQLFRRDLRLNPGDPVEEMVGLLEQRQQRGAVGYEDVRDELSQLMRRSLMAYAERALLLKMNPGKWLMGHGSPVPRELLTVGLQTMLAKSLDVLRELVLDNQKFVFVPSAPRELLLLTLGDTLGPYQFLIVDTLYDQMNHWARESIYSRAMGRRVREFVEEVGPQVVRGVYRASAHAPAQVFYAHVARAQEAALLAMADSVLQEYRNFPMLLALADSLCRINFEAASFKSLVQQSYAQAGQPYRFLGERETR